MALIARIQGREAKVVVVGLGYVGLPLAVEIAKTGFTVTGYDKSSDKVRAIASGRSYINDVPREVLAPLVAAGKLRASNDPDVMTQADAVILCVPTPLNKTKDPDNSFIMAAADELAPRLKSEMLVILESTTFPGFTREILVPRLEETGLTVGKDFYVAFSPERVDPGNNHYGVKNTPKVIGGSTTECLANVKAFYSQFIDQVIPVSSTDAAEMVKLLENTFRAVNIGLVNEVAMMCHKLGLNTWDIIDAAATKPFGFLPFYPGPGLGGHCIPVDPHYLSWKLKTLKYNARFIELAGEINSSMPELVVRRLQQALNERARAVKDARILLMGIAYKRDIDDVRESPALDILELLLEQGARVAYHDPFVPRVEIGTHVLTSTALQNISAYDAVVIVTDHSQVDYGRLVREAKFLFDTRNATKSLRADPELQAKIMTL